MEDNPSWVAYRAGQTKSFCIVCVSGTHYDEYGETIKTLISTAYRIDARLVVAPDWVNREVTSGSSYMPSCRRALPGSRLPICAKTLLEERFHLVVHRAVVEQVGYALVTAKNGPKLKEPGDLDRSACDDWELNLANQEGNQMCRTSKEVGDRTVNITMMTRSASGPLLTEIWRGESPEVRQRVVQDHDAEVSRPRC